ncbi:MAG: hypothetical protein NTX50_11215, partial [Candidatus Sumerlaeota bacterium]|nr:hypothetical protein [Candidatus Sumerlaeota bacterium]
MNKADRYLNQGEYFQARDLYYKSIDWYPLPKAYHGLGCCELSGEQWTRAAYFFNQALAAAPNNKQFAAWAQYATARSKGIDAAKPSLELEPTAIAEAGIEKKTLTAEMERKLALAEPEKKIIASVPEKNITQPEPIKPAPVKPEPVKPEPVKPTPRPEPIKPEP